MSLHLNELTWELNIDKVTPSVVASIRGAQEDLADVKSLDVPHGLVPSSEVMENDEVPIRTGVDTVATNIVSFLARLTSTASN